MSAREIWRTIEQVEKSPLWADAGLREAFQPVYDWLAKQAVVWDEGYQACAEEIMHQQCDPSYPVTRPNPYIRSGVGFPEES